MDDSEEMVRELNKTNDLFRFVRLMRDKFLKATLSGKYTDSHPYLLYLKIRHLVFDICKLNLTKTCALFDFSELPTHSENLQQETSIISASAPGLSFTTDTNMSTPENKVSNVQVNRRHKRSSDSPLVSPVPTSSVRRSSRFKVPDTYCAFNVAPNLIQIFPRVGYWNLSS